MIDGFVTLPALAIGAFFTVSFFIDPSTIVVDKIDVPGAMEDKGYNGEVTAERFSDALAHIAESAGTNRGNLVSEERARAKSVEALTDWFGFARPIRAAQVALGFLPYTFAGEVVEDKDKLFLHVRGQSPSFYHFEIVSEGTIADPDGMIEDAAFKLMRHIDPYMLAVYHFRRDFRTKDFTQTFKELDHCLVAAPKEQIPWVYALWGHALFRLGKNEQAIIKYRQAMLLDPTFPRPMMRWGEVLASEGKHDEAINRFKKTLEIEPRYPEALVFWAKSLEAKGDLATARSKYEDAAHMAPDFARVRHSYGKFLESQGENLSAQIEFRKAYDLDRGKKSYTQSLRRIQRKIDPALSEIAPL
ncbi:MAG: tetratricopeptide repeat protein [Rhodospirillaceae bacterium]|jgi:Tfp pilus assembly protein PilF|nr:tetratricopeptide repeat protein [Rhodospirillaceae bacterium]MBT6137905.1 tetratricopeptide repeat protein [Rhodospirillaceae bacterium]